MTGFGNPSGDGASPTLILMRIVFYGKAAILLGVAVVATLRIRAWLAHAECAPGVIVDLNTHRGSGNDVTYAPVVAFELPDGRTVRFTSRTRSYPAPYRHGEAVMVLYHAVAPENAAIEGFRSLWLGPTICGVIGLVFLGLSLLIL